MAITSSCGTWAVTWPYPQAIFGKYYTLAFAVADKDDCATGIPAADDSLVLYELYCSESDVWTADYIASFGLVSSVNQVGIVDFGYFYAATAFGYIAGVPTITGIFRLPGVTKPSVQYTSLETVKVPKFIAGCNFNGQAVIGGIISTDARFEGLGLDSVCWSRIGEFDFRPDVVKTAGYRKMEWGEWGEGIVYKVHKLGKYVIVLGDGGSAVLIPASKPVPTFGYKNLPVPGIHSGNHVAGDEHVLLVIDSNYDLWLIDGNVRPRKLGYREWMQDLLTYTHETNDYRTLVSYVPSKKRFYLSNGNDCYVLTEHGLYTCNQRVTSAGDYRGKVLCGFFSDNADYQFRLETGITNFGMGGFKTLQHLLVNHRYVKSTYDLNAMVKYKNDVGTATMSETSWKALGPEGVVAPVVTANEFSIALKGTDYRTSDLVIDSMEARLKVSDKRFVRGI